MIQSDAYIEEYPVVKAFFEKNKKAYEQFKECFDCKLMYLYKEDRLPYGKCTHPSRPMMKVPCGVKKKKWKGSEYHGIAIPDLKE